MFKVKLILYLLCSDSIISLNTRFVFANESDSYIDDIQKSGAKKDESISTDLTTTTTTEETQNVDDRPPIDNSPGASRANPEKPSLPTATDTTTTTTSSTTTGIDSTTTTIPSTTTKQSSEPTTTEAPPTESRSVNEEDIEEQAKSSDNQRKDVNPPYVSPHTFDSMDPFTISGDGSIATTFNEIERLPGLRQGIEWNTSSVSERFLLPELSDNTKLSLPATQNKFIDERHLLRTASHGLFFDNHGEALIFHEVFDHFIRFDIPKIEILQKEFEREHCIKFIKDSFISLSKTADGDEFLEDKCRPISPGGGPPGPCYREIPERISNICNRLIHYYGKQIEELRDIIDDTYSSFEKNLRRKRFVVTATIAGAIVVGSLAAGAIGGGVVGGITGYFSGKAGAKHEVEKLEGVLREMEKKMGQMQESVQVNNKILAGLSKEVTDMEKDIKREMRLMSEGTRFQIKNLETTIKQISQELEKEVRFTAIMTYVENYVNLHLSSLRNNMILQLQRIKNWEEIFNTLSFGRLSKKLIGYNELKYLLKQVYQNVFTNFDLALTDAELPLYYTLPLTTYSITNTTTGYALYIHLRVPLKIIKISHRFDIIAVQSHSFPCLNNGCILDKGKLQNGTLQSFDLPQLSYLVNQKTHEIQHEINLDYLSCQDSGRTKLCWTYNPTMLQKPSTCTNAIYRWNESKIVDWCKFKPTRKEEYKVIPMSFNRYLMHRDIVHFYHQFCGDKPPERIYLTRWAEILEIPEYCEVYIASTNQKLLGPFSDLLRSSTNASRLSYESRLISRISAKYDKLTRIEVPIHDTGRFIRGIENRFKSNENADKIIEARLTSEELSKVALFNIKAQQELKESMNNLDTKYKTYKYTGTFWGYISLFGDSIQMTVNLVVVFGLLSYLNLFGLIGATLVIVQPRPVEGWDIQLIPDIKLFPDITVDVMEDVTSIAFFMNIGFVFLFIAFSVLFVCYGVFRKVVITQHYGKGFPLSWTGEDSWENCNYCLMLHLNYEGHLIRCIKIENLHIKLNIDTYFSTAVKKIRVKNRVMTWFIVSETGSKAIQLSEPVHLMGYNANNERIEEVNYHVSIPIDLSAFNSVPRSEAIRKKGNYGNAFVDTIVKARHPMAGKSSEEPPRYIEVFPPSAPIADDRV